MGIATATYLLNWYDRGESYSGPDDEDQSIDIP